MLPRQNLNGHIMIVSEIADHAANIADMDVRAVHPFMRMAFNLDSYALRDMMEFVSGGPSSKPCGPALDLVEASAPGIGRTPEKRRVEPPICERQPNQTQIRCTQ